MYHELWLYEGCSCPGQFLLVVDAHVDVGRGRVSPALILLPPFRERLGRFVPGAESFLVPVFRARGRRRGGWGNQQNKRAKIFHQIQRRHSLFSQDHGD